MTQPGRDAPEPDPVRNRSDVDRPYYYDLLRNVQRRGLTRWGNVGVAAFYVVSIGGGVGMWFLTHQGVLVGFFVAIVVVIGLFAMAIFESIHQAQDLERAEAQSRSKGMPR
jgi:uncharacterized membrane protein